jgi:hypothetical protein
MIDEQEVPTKHYDTNPYWMVRGTFAEKRERLASMDRAWLEGIVLDTQLQRLPPRPC